MKRHRYYALSYFIVKLFSIVIFASHLQQTHANTYKLNVPKVLLPFQSSKIVSFQLELKQEDDTQLSDDDTTCFLWSSSRPEIVSIQPIYELNKNGQECSKKAIVSAISKYPERITSIVLAKEANTDKIIRCDVIVDRINKISIKHTTTQLFLEDSPECFTTEGFDTEGNTFTSIDGLPFEWSILTDSSKSSGSTIDSRNVLRMVNLIDSEYEVSESIRKLEDAGFNGNKILIEGVKTGTANVQAKLLDQYYVNMYTNSVRLLVVANILLEPSFPVYMLVGSKVNYQVLLIKQTSIEKIELPSTQYYFESKNNTCAKLESPSGSVIVGVNYGQTEIVLIDRNMKEFAAEQYTPPTSKVYVVEADHLIFNIKNWRSWILQVGLHYEIQIFAYTRDRHLIHPSDNLIIKGLFDNKKFDVIRTTKNGSYYHLFAKSNGLTVANASLKGTFDNSNNIEFRVAYGQQEIELLDPIEIIPKQLVFAWKANTIYEYQLRAKGGSSQYQWQSKNTTVAIISNSGLLRTANRIGETQVFAYDAKNVDIQASAKVYVLPPVSLDIIACPVETHVNQQLNLHVRMLTSLNGNEIEINDCSKLDFDLSIEDTKVFRFVRIKSNHEDHQERSSDGSCAIVVLEAISEGSTQIRVSYNVTDQVRFIKSQQIFSYSQLKTNKQEFLLTKHSIAYLRTIGGPYLEDDYQQLNAPEAQLYEENLNVDHNDIVTVSKQYDYKLSRSIYKIECKKTSDTKAKVKLSISNKKTRANQCPIEFKHEVTVKCAQPYKLELSQLFNETQLTSFYRQPLPKCTLKSKIYAHSSKPMNIVVTVRDEFDNEFDNFTSVKIEWNIKDKHLFELSREHGDIKSIEGENKTIFYQVFDTHNRLGTTKLVGKLDHKIESDLEVNMVNDIQVEPNLITLFNHPTNVQTLTVLHGSGYYFTEIESKNIVKSELNLNNLVLTPTNNGQTYINVYDYCVPSSNEAKAHVLVAGINSILVETSDNKVQIGDYLYVFVQISDGNGNLLKKNLFELMNLRAKLTNAHATITYDHESNKRINDDFTAVYILKAENVGVIGVQYDANLHEGPLIQSRLKEIQIYAPLEAEPKYIELIVGSIFQIQIKGGPNSDDTTIKYEVEVKQMTAQSKQREIIHIYSNGTMYAMAFGYVSVTVKAVGACTKYHRHNFDKNKECGSSEIVYSKDQIHVRVITLNSIHIQAPLKHIKRGNEMPIYLFGNSNDLKSNCLTPLYFGSSEYLSYKWSINNENVATLSSVFSESGLKTSLNTFSIRLIAKQIGIVRISVEVTSTRADIINSTTHKLNDYLDINIYNEAYLMNKRIDLSQQQQQLLLSTGTQVHLKTNRDGLASKIDYQLFFNNEGETVQSSGKLKQKCTNSTLSIDKNGLLSVTSNLDKVYCTATLQVRVEEEFKKVQYINYLIKIRPIQYLMIKSQTQIKVKSTSDDKIESYELNQLPNGLTYKYRLNYYDDLGDKFDYVNIGTKYTANRYDLMQFMQSSSSSLTATQSGLETTTISLDNDDEHSFLLSAINSGRFIISLSTISEHSFNTEFAEINTDYLNLFGDLSNTQFHKYDLIYLNTNFLIEKIVDNRTTNSESEHYWSVDESNTDSSALNSIRFLSKNVALCVNEGQVSIKLKSANQLIDHKSVKIDIKSYDKVTLIDKQLTNLIIGRKYNLHFQFGSESNFKTNVRSLDSNKFDAELSAIKYTPPFNCNYKITKVICKMCTLHDVVGDSLYLSNNIEFKPVFHDGYWSCQLEYGENFQLDHYYDSLSSASSTEIPRNIYVWLSTVAKNEVDYYNLQLMPQFYIKTKQIEMVVRNINDKRTTLKHSCHFNVRLIDTLVKHINAKTNHPNLIEVKKKDYIESRLELPFELVLIEFDLNNLINTLEHDRLFVEISSPLSEQVEKIPIKIQFDIGPLDVTTYESRPYVTSRLVSLFHFNEIQIITFLILSSFALIIILYILKTKLQVTINPHPPPPPQPSRQIGITTFNRPVYASQQAADQYLRQRLVSPPDDDYTRTRQNISGNTSFGSQPVKLFSVDHDGSQSFLNSSYNSDHSNYYSSGTN